MSLIDPLASVHPGAKIGKNVSIAPFAVVEEGAVIGDDCQIGPQAYITRWAILGNSVKVSMGAVIGTDPQDLKFEGENTTAEIGDRTVIREFATINRGTHHSKKTVIGADCMIMSYVHIAHDCKIGNNVIIANGVNLAGHITIEDNAGIGGMVGFHQFVRVGQHCFVGGMSAVRKDVPPYVIAEGNPLDFRGLNSIGLRRRGFDAEAIMELKRAYKLIYRSGKNVSNAIKELKEMKNILPEVQNVIDFIDASDDRGLMGRHKGKAQD
jgi:UDP-N-acetylglucosamine acyltransferase